MTGTKKLLAVLAAVLTIYALPAVIHAEDQGKERPGHEMNEGKEGKREKHPAMMRALHALENAKHALERAAHDFGGHRAKALEDTEAAIKEVKEGLKYDRK